MRIILNLVKKNILLNKKLFLAIICGIALSVSLIFTIFNTKENLNKTIQDITFKDYGAYHYEIQNVDKEKVEHILNNKLVKDYYFAHIDLVNPKVIHVDDNFINKQSIKITEGKLEFDKYLYSESKINLKNLEKVSGYFQKYDSNLILTKIKDYRDVNIYIELKDYKKDKEFEKVLKNIIFNKNKPIYSYYNGKNSNIRFLDILSNFAITIVIIASFVIINNSFSISFSEKIKQIGILSSVGATKKQISQFLKLESFIVGFIGYILGMIVGLTASLILGKYLTNAFLILSDNNFILKNEIHYLSFVISAILIFITIYFVIIKLSYKYSRITVIESIKNKNYVKLKEKEFDKKITNPSLFLAKRNLKISKKKYRTTVISITISVILFINMNTFIGYYLQMYGNYQQTYDVIVNLNNKENIDHEYTIKKYKEILSKTSYSYVLSVNNKEKIEILNVIEDKEFKNINSDLNQVLNFQDIYKNKKIYGKLKFILSADKKVKYISESNFKLNKDKYKVHKIMLAYTKTKEDKETKFLEKARIEDKDLIFKNITIIDITKISEKYRLLIEISQILIYGFITVLSLIGVTNIFNVVSSNMKLRKSDFATLKSIGITSKEFNKMIIYESIVYSIKSLIIGITISLIISYLMYVSIFENVKEIRELTYQFPYKGIIISIFIVFVIILMTMRYSIKKIDEDNIIDTIRNENI